MQKIRLWRNLSIKFPTRGSTANQAHGIAHSQVPEEFWTIPACCGFQEWGSGAGGMLGTSRTLTSS